jgi:hypothetical protein
MSATATGTVLRDPALDGLGDVVASLVEDNLTEHPDRWHLVQRAWAVHVHVIDAESSFAVAASPGGVLVTPDISGSATFVVSLDGDTLVALPEIPLVAGLPDPRTPEGRALLGQVLRRDLRIRGLVRRLGPLRRLLRLLNTAG